MSKFLSYPREGDTIRSIHIGGNYYFPIGGWADPAQPDKYPNYAYFAKQSDSKATPLLLGHLYHEPTPNRAAWGFWFNARGLDLSQMYQLVIARVDSKTGSTTLLAWVEKLRLSGGQEGLTIIHPTSNVPAGTISPYGNFTSPDTTVVRVELLKNSVVVATDNNPYADFGFWSGSFSSIATGTGYAVRAVGNNNTKTGDTFDVS